MLTVSLYVQHITALDKEENYKKSLCKQSKNKVIGMQAKLKKKMRRKGLDFHTHKMAEKEIRFAEFFAFRVWLQKSQSWWLFTQFH